MGFPESSCLLLSSSGRLCFEAFPFTQRILSTQASPEITAGMPNSLAAFPIPMASSGDFMVLAVIMSALV